MPFCSERGSAALLLGLLFPVSSSSRALQGSTSRPTQARFPPFRDTAHGRRGPSSHSSSFCQEQVIALESRSEPGGKIKWVTSNSPHLHPSTQQLMEKSKEKVGEAEGLRGLWREVCTGYHACCQPPSASHHSLAFTLRREQ